MGFSETNAEIMTILIGLINMCSSVPAIYFSDRLPLKRLVYYGGVGMSFSYLLLSMCLFVIDFDGYQLALGIIALFSIFTFIITFELSIGPIMWIYCADILNSKGLSVVTSLNWIGAAFIAVIGDVLLNRDGNYKYMCLGFLFFSAVLAWFAKYRLMEPRNLSEDELYRFRKSKNSSDNQAYYFT